MNNPSDTSTVPLATEHAYPRTSFGVDTQTCLDVVGLSLADIQAAAARELSTGTAYVVGSLASGLGNAGSDVDIHIIRGGISAEMGPYMHFMHGVVVDMKCFPETWPSQILEQIRHLTLGDPGVGAVYLGETPEPVAGWPVLARWLHAAPLHRGQPPLFSEEEAAVLLPLLVRRAFDDLLIAISCARLADAASAPAPTSAYLWGDASTRLLELRCRAAGDVTSNRKWLPARARRLGLEDSAAAHDEVSFQQLAKRCGLRAVDAWRLTRVAPAPDGRQVSMAGGTWFLNRHGRMRPEAWSVDGTVEEAVAHLGASRVLAALRHAEADIAIESHALGEALTR